MAGRSKYLNHWLHSRPAYFYKFFGITNDSHWPTIRSRCHRHLVKLRIWWPFHRIQLTFPKRITFSVERSSIAMVINIFNYRYVIPGRRTNQSHVVDKIGIFPRRLCSGLNRRKTWNNSFFTCRHRKIISPNQIYIEIDDKQWVRQLTVDDLMFTNVIMLWSVKCIQIQYGPYRNETQYIRSK